MHSQHRKGEAPGRIPGAETKRAAGAQCVSGTIIQRTAIVVKGIEPPADADSRTLLNLAEEHKAAGNIRGYLQCRRLGLLAQARTYGVEVEE